MTSWQQIVAVMRQFPHARSVGPSELRLSFIHGRRRIVVQVTDRSSVISLRTDLGSTAEIDPFEALRFNLDGGHRIALSGDRFVLCAELLGGTNEAIVRQIHAFVRVASQAARRCPLHYELPAFSFAM